QSIHQPRPLCHCRMAWSAAISRPTSSPSTYSFFFKDSATTELYTLSLHDALPIFAPGSALRNSNSRRPHAGQSTRRASLVAIARDRKSTRLNSSHVAISYAVFCLKKKSYTSRPCRESAATRGSHGLPDCLNHERLG